ncbi:MAG: hypothetical protein B9S34_04740 [Opitutia bacterium Tous-C1TDCM]|nr:MAG: hypothetical protein B9S34_04740 [Opitutae bacterium Tous-C1TDCM]
MLRRLVSLCLLGLATVLPSHSESAADLVRAGLAAEANREVRRALDLFLAAEKAAPPDGFLLQKIAQQYSDLTPELPTKEEKRTSAERALAYSQRAVAADPKNAVNVLSVAVSYGKLAVYSDTRDKVRYSRFVLENAERALALDPAYAWAHHVAGRWNYEVATLGATARFFVRLFYGGLPEASVATAVRHLRRALELEPGELQHHLELGFALLAAGDPAAARAAWQHGLGLPSKGIHDEPAKARARAALADLGPA